MENEQSPPLPAWLASLEAQCSPLNMRDWEELEDHLKALVMRPVAAIDAAYRDDIAPLLAEQKAYLQGTPEFQAVIDRLAQRKALYELDKAAVRTICANEAMFVGVGSVSFARLIQTAAGLSRMIWLMVRRQNPEIRLEAIQEKIIGMDVQLWKPLADMIDRVHKQKDEGPATDPTTAAPAA